ncbi:MAG: M23 family metallopeptidase [Chthoniobacterales bacterium]
MTNPIKLALLILVVGTLSFFAAVLVKLWPELTRPTKLDLPFQQPSPLVLAALPTAARFDFPLGSENGAMSYNAQRFTENEHLGDDLNGIGGEDSDLGDPIYAVADGRVLLAQDGGLGWGNVVILLHAYIDNGERKYVQSYYGHVQAMLVHAGDEVRRGQQIATVGTANGQYFAHLHFEMREFTTPFVGPGYRKDTHGWIDPSAFIRAHRGAPEDDVGRMPLR